MNFSDSLLCLWPGLPKLWLRGQWSSLIPAILFAILLNLALIQTFLWPGWLSFASTYLLWPIISVMWIGSAVVSFSQLPDLLLVPQQKQEAGNGPDLLPTAQKEYLKGNFVEAELLLKRQIANHPDDVPSGLLLATLYCHQNKLALAKRWLSKLSAWDQSLHWQLEMDQLWAQIEQQEEETDTESTTDYQNLEANDQMGPILQESVSEGN